MGSQLERNTQPPFLVILVISLHEHIRNLYTLKPIAFLSTHESLISQVDRLNAELLSERARHERLVQELRERHEGEMDLIRQGYQEEGEKLQREIDQLKEGSVKVRYSMYRG